ncbi:MULTISPECIES: phosphoribosylformylglycinamidine synthase subunit PurS [Rummeliibacillus]|uniref:Phosphoribosylformylglycinamidine synthase subunit PurS n=1 Tax=Rummeliibacillus stabekisii TaxID=241244 RepID=A0A143H946_9BACL|nr:MULTISPECIES: phosphoribosylformylglycinamidine synthase subunit PurS [Rummeliibacillus]AMW98232.1 phosphoribosylformylglycinamidine synthase subunit PurS [Rummeliibacillus stabekisii]
MYKVQVYITLRESVLDPQGSAVKQSLHSLGYKGIEELRIGKYLELTIDQKEQDIDGLVNEVCQKLLANTVIEDYRYDIKEVAAL